MKFISGNKYPPIGGFTGMNGDRTWLYISYNPDSKDLLPIAHTCYECLELSNYSSREVMKDRITFAVNYHVLDDEE